MMRRLRQAIGESLGLKILFSAFAIIVAVLTAFTLFAVMRESAKAKNELQERGRTLSAIFAHSSIVGIYTENGAMLAESAQGITDLKDIVEAAVYNAEYNMLYRKSKEGTGTTGTVAFSAADAPTSDESPRIREREDVFEFVRPVLLQTSAEADESIYFDAPEASGKKRVIGFVRIVLSKDAYHHEIASMIGQHAVVMAVFIVASIVGTYMRLRHVTRPLEQLTRSVQAFERGLPVEPVPVETKDEVGNLAAAFNAMAAARGKAEESLRESEDRYRRLIELSPDAVYVQSAGRFVFMNRAAARLLGRAEPSDLIGLPVEDHIHEADRERHARRIRSVMDDQAVSSLLPVRYLLPNGTAVDAEAAAAPFAFQGQNAVLVIARDITERKGLEEMVRTYQRELLDAEHAMISLESRVEERERHLIAADLHDYVGQNLVLLQFRLGALQKGLSEPETLRALEDLRELIGQTIQYTRSLTVELSPPVLFEIGFTAAVETLAEGFRKSHGLSVTVADDGLSDDIPADVRNLLFRSVRELLMNVVKHARARTVSILLRRTDGQLTVTVADDGAGFDASTATGTKAGFGLFSIRERMKRMNGSCAIESRPGSGTTIVLAVPRDRESCSGHQSQGQG
jgi:PAS domain S-box-containing protein